MNIIKKIRQILSNDKLDLADKIIEIEGCLPKEKEVEMGEMFGEPCQIKREGNTIVFDGSVGGDYTDSPRLENEDDLYYTGSGCTWGIDLDGKRYWKQYSPFITNRDVVGNSRYIHLSFGDIIDEAARVRKIVHDYLSQRGI